MEDTEFTKIIQNQNIRQSKEWCGYFEFLRWSAYRTTGGINVFIRELGPMSLVKIERPRLFTSEELAEIEGFCKEKKAAFIKVEPVIGQDLSVLDKAGYLPSGVPLSPPSELVIDLTQPEEKLWAAVSHSGKYSINRAKREGIHTKFFASPDRAMLEMYYSIIKHRGDLKKYYVQPKSDLLTKAELFKDKCYLSLAYDAQNNVAGGKLYLGNTDVVVYHNGGTSNYGQNNKAGYDLMWQAIPYFKNLGYKLLNLEGLDDDRFPKYTKDWGGFSHFKEKFGGIKVVYPCPYVKYLNPLFKIFSRFGALAV